MIDFAWPWIFTLLPLPWILRWLLPEANMQMGAALQAPFLMRLKNIAGTATLSHRSHRLRLLSHLTWLLLVIAASGPQWLGPAVALPQSGRDIMLAVDISGSMQIKDFILHRKATSRLKAVKSVASAFIAQRKGDRVGLILFGSKAYLQTPLTFDRDTVQYMLDDASIGLAGPETSIGDAIGLAVKRLRQLPKAHRILILLTDGANNRGALKPEQAATLAAKSQIKIYTIGVGADRLTVDGFFGPQTINPSTDLDVGVLRKIADTTGGQYFRAKNTAALEKIYRIIDKQEPIAHKHQTFRPITPLYPWPLGLALLITVLYSLTQLPLPNIRLRQP